MVKPIKSDQNQLLQTRGKRVFCLQDERSGSPFLRLFGQDDHTFVFEWTILSKALNELVVKVDQVVNEEGDSLSRIIQIVNELKELGQKWRRVLNEQTDGDGRHVGVLGWEKSRVK